MAMASSAQPTPRRTNEASKLKEVVAELRLCRFVLCRGLQEMQKLDDNDTPTRRDNILKCIAVVIEGLELGERMADSVVTDISSFTVHQVWECSIRERHRAEHPGPPQLVPKHHWLVSSEDAVKLKTADLLRLGRQATERMTVALTARHVAWSAVAATAAAAAPGAAVSTAASTPPYKRRPPETALVAVGSSAIDSTKRSRRLQHLDYPRPEGKYYLSQGDICIALDKAVEGLTDSLLRQQHLRRVKKDMVIQQHTAMTISQINKWYARWCNPAMRHRVCSHSPVGRRRTKEHDECGQRAAAL